MDINFVRKIYTLSTFDGKWKWGIRVMPTPSLAALRSIRRTLVIGQYGSVHCSICHQVPDFVRSVPHPFILNPSFCQELRLFFSVA